MLNKISKIIYFLILFLFTSVSAEIPAHGKIRGLWVVRYTLTDAAKIDSMLETAAESGITDLFVQVRGRGDAFYRSSYESMPEELGETGFDPLEYILNHPLARSVRIHAWLNVFFIWSSDSLPGNLDHIVHKNQDWLALPSNMPDFLLEYPHSAKRKGVEGLFVSPLQPQAQHYFLAVMKDILNRYPVDGIHLDYIRYPDQSFDINPDVVKDFQRRYVLDPKEFLANPELFAQKFSISGYEIFFYHWRRYLMDGLSDFVKRISDTLATHAPEVMLSAAVKPDIIQARWNYYQAWDQWVKNGYLDFAVPMNYTPDPDLFSRRVDSYMQSLPASTFLVGISLYNQKTEQAIRKIAQINALNNSGFVLFSYNQLKNMPYLIKFLKTLKNSVKKAD